MDPRDHLRALMDGLACTVCNEPVPVDRIRLLARRDDLAFIQIECVGCGSTTLEFLAGAPSGSVPLPPRPVVTAGDVLAMHEFLEAWTGDFGALLSPLKAGRPADPGPGS